MTSATGRIRICVCLFLLLSVLVGVGFTGFQWSSAGVRWSGTQLQVNPRLFLGRAGDADQWLDAYFDNENVLVVKMGDCSGDVPFTGITRTMIEEAIGSGAAPPVHPASPNFYPPPSWVTQYVTARESTQDISETASVVRYYLPASNASGDGSCPPPQDCVLWSCSSCPSCCFYTPPDGEVGDWRLYCGLDSSYRETRYDALAALGDRDAYGRGWRTRVQAHAIRERLALSLGMTVDEFWATGALDDTDSTSLGFDFTPQYYVFQQGTEYIDLVLFGTVGAEHRWFDGEQLSDDELDAARWGGGIGAGRTFRFGDLWMIYLWHRHQNLDGDDGLAGGGSLDVHRVGGVYTVPLARNLRVQAALYYTHVPELPEGLDGDDLEGEVKLSYRRGGWSFSLGGSRLFASRDLDSWRFFGGLDYAW